MFIGAGIKNDDVAEETVIAGENVGLDDFKCESDVGIGVDVRERGGEIVGRHRLGVTDNDNEFSPNGGGFELRLDFGEGAAVERLVHFGEFATDEDLASRIEMFA